MTLLQGPKDPVSPTLLYIHCPLQNFFCICNFHEKFCISKRKFLYSLRFGIDKKIEPVLDKNGNPIQCCSDHLNCPLKPDRCDQNPICDKFAVYKTKIRDNSLVILKFPKM